ncbi:histone-lysine N-methyltransferase ASHH2 isoform X2 [Arabidopsis lyrata subsp. lyrata]|uniref:histone-lysine N-methyltransferase ASHH2 isoform X2 n=1 Tax=Arabidopsis lyrata subsp. lyrata TaxID=81972 RepID=UPI000A29A7C7|nr:histone-lysine N-methyltransferase ASHH2 isoform X2 [Arabidopsis lyrata subsp. lyrata]|eukprot:XP_020889612.1 histone-lysine N-methyltransferase ASHH2 isoform X2 [Arabidopsis lyrata subsp. lyrata]
MDCKENGIRNASACDIDANSLASNLAMDINEDFYEKLSSCGHNIDSVSSLETPQVASVGKHTIEGQGKCFIEIEQMGDGNSNSEEDAGNTDDGLYVCYNADDTRKQGVVSGGLEQTHEVICDADLLVNCNKLDDGKESQDTNLSLVSIVSGSMQEKGAPQAKEDEDCGGTTLPIGGNGIDNESTFVNDAPEQFKSLETTKQRKPDEVDSGGISYTFDDGGKEGKNEPSSDQDNGSSDDISLIQSFSFPDSLLDSSVFGCSATENYLEDASAIEGNVPIVVSPSLAITEMLNNHDGGLCSYDLNDITVTETINPELKLVHEDELDTDLSEKNEKMLKNLVGDSSSESAVAALSMNNGMAADLRAENFSQISPIDDKSFCMEANSPITDSSLIWNFPLNFGNGGNEVCNPDNAVEPLRIIDDNGRIGGEVASASGTNFCETGLSSSRRKTRDGKQCKVAQTKMSARHPRKSTRKKQSERNLESIFKCSKQKRSSLLKTSRSFEWGLPSKTTEIFLQSKNIPYDGPPHHEPQRPQGNLNNGQHNRSSHNGYVEGANRNIQASSGSCLRLKVKFGKSGTCLELLGSANFAEDKPQTVETREDLVEKSNPVEKVSYLQSSDSMRDKKNNQDAAGLCRKLGGDVLDDDPHLSSIIMVEECERATGTRSLDAETSPDSEVINSVPESIVNIEHKEGLHHGFFTTPEDVVKKNRVVEKEDELLASKSPLENGSHLIPSAKKGKHSKSKSNGTKKGKSKISESAKDGRKNESHEGVEQPKSLNTSIGRDDSDYLEVGRIESHKTTGALLDADIGKTSATYGTISSDVTNVETVVDFTIEDSYSTESAWVRCDDCFKWRRIPASVVGSIDESSRWICLNNSDKKFADCSKSQEMSNEEINEELGIGQDEADAYDCDAAKRGKEKEQKSKRLTGKQKACFKAIKTNQFLHRNRKSQTIDEIMVCHCKPPPDGRLGCGEECLNRMLNIECLQGTCPAGDLCSNQQFQKRKYVKFERFQSGKKGYGLRLLEDVREGQFLIEYVGEVLDMQSYDTRQKEYACKGQKHFYFMTLNGNEVIDAGAKGNLGRFINHSCEPNCRTEKWMVNGEICVGIFSMKDLKKGQELTFDYNYVRVFGAAAKKCYCGSSHCRGYIGGDPLNGDVIIQSDSDEEYPELVILDDDESGEGILDATSRTFIDDADEQMPQNSETVNGSKDLAPDNAQSQSSVSVKLPEREIPPPLLQPTEVLKELPSGIAVSAVQQEVPVEKKTKSTSPTSSSLSRLSSGGANTDMTTKHGSGEDKKILPRPRPRPRMKTSRLSVSSKRDKGGILSGVNKAQIIPVNKLQQQPIKSKGSEEVSSSGRIETFEGKLNELLDAVGGISKRRDSAKGYLKLLLLTAASRGTEGVHSNRDLSMILDALLKTKSKSVLVDVINKNGLQMLHNIMKQYRSDFKRIPILRKLLKVLEYLATREILALEHIIRRPPCVGMESFKDSILSFTEHADITVHRIARSFRDRWIPKHFRKPWRIDREERSESMRSPINSRFRASQEPRYEHKSPRPAEPAASVTPSMAATPETASVSEGYSEPNSSLPETNGRKRKSRWDQPSKTKEQRTMTISSQQTDETNGNQDVQDDLPPGFSSPCTDVPDAITAQPQQKFLSCLPVSYGIPLSIVHQFGSPGKEDPTTWSVAPGMPFYPFPPLPPVSHGEFFAKRNVIACSSSIRNPTYSNEILPATPVTDSTAPNRKRESSFDIGTTYFRQQKQNVPPWLRNNGWEKTVNSPIPGNLTLEKKLNS